MSALPRTCGELCRTVASTSCHASCGRYLTITGIQPYVQAMARLKFNPHPLTVWGKIFDFRIFRGQAGDSRSLFRNSSRKCATPNMPQIGRYALQLGIDSCRVATFLFGWPTLISVLRNSTKLRASPPQLLPFVSAMAALPPCCGGTITDNACNPPRVEASNKGMR